MREYKRGYPRFALCGLNCGLCPRYQTEGKSKCPGCGGEDFHLKHPACAVITCNKKHDQVEFCYQCSAYPCKKYRQPSETDSFITYRNVLSDFEKAHREGIEQYIAMLDEKIEILKLLIEKYNAGRSKNFYCIAVNLFDLDTLRAIMKKISNEIEISADLSTAVKIDQVRILFESEAEKAGIELNLKG